MVNLMYYLDNNRPSGLFTNPFGTIEKQDREFVWSNNMSKYNAMSQGFIHVTLNSNVYIEVL